MGVTGYLYPSVIDSLSDYKLKVKDYRNVIMSIGRLHYMQDKEFQKIKMKYRNSNEDKTGLTQQVKSMFGAMTNVNKAEDQLKVKEADIVDAEIE